MNEHLTCKLARIHINTINYKRLHCYDILRVRNCAGYYLHDRQYRNAPRLIFGGNLSAFFPTDETENAHRSSCEREKITNAGDA